VSGRISQVRVPAADPPARGRARILAVGNMYPPQHAGGYELCWQAAMRQARAAGHEVRVLTSDYRAGEAAEEDPDVHRTLRWYWDLERYRFANQGRLQRFGIARHDAGELGRHLDEFRPDVVSWWSMGCLPLAMVEQVRRAGIPAIFVAHDDWLIYTWTHDAWLRTWRGRRRMLAPFAERLTGAPTQVDLERAGRFVFNSSYTLQRAQQAGFAAEGAGVVHPGIDERLLEGSPASAPWRWRLAYVGRIDRQKGVDTALTALAQLPAQATLTVWGTGDDRYIEEMKALASARGLADRARFEGFAEGERLRRAYTDADVVVFPVRWNEPFGLVPLEAMALGRPVISTLRGGTAEYIRDGENALVIPADDPRALARAVERLAAEETLRARMLQRGRATAERYGRARFAERIVAEILAVVRSPAGAAQQR
jgi:glycogen(starch) synthase